MVSRETSYEIASDQDSVELWSDVRLPFEPEGIMKEARATLRQAVRKLPVEEGHWLAAQYVSAAADFVDMENVLFYNVGSGAFSRLIGPGLTATRSHERPPVSPKGLQYSHYQSYRIQPAPSVRRSGTFLVFQSPPLNTATKPHDVWWAASAGSATRAAAIAGRYRLVVEVPRSTSQNLAASMKPLLDGIISAMHWVDHIDESAVGRLSEATRWEASDIIRRLQRPAAPILGPRTVLCSYRNFIKWDPADDLCDAFTLCRSAGDELCRVWVSSCDPP
jgi:hypothetical protein